MFWATYGGFYGQRPKFRPVVSEGEDLSEGKDWADFPLTSMGIYIFAEIGAWKSLEELEDSLILPELLEFVSACRMSDHRNLKIAAMAQGAETDLDEADYGFGTGTGPVKEAASGFEVSHLPIGIGFSQE